MNYSMSATADTPATLIQLARSASLRGRPGIALLAEDRHSLDERFGSPMKTNRLIQRLHKEGQILQIRRGAYALPDATGSFRQNILDLIDALTPQPYLVSGGRALEFHELTDQHFHQIHVLRDRQGRSWKWQGTTVKYVKTTSPLHVRATRTSRTKARIATAERAIADSLANPGWGITVAQVTHALRLQLGRESGSSDELAVVAAKLQNHALARRLGYLVELVSDPDSARPFLPLIGLNKAATPLLVGGPKGGPIDRRWKVRINTDPDHLLNYSEQP